MSHQVLPGACSSLPSRRQHPARPRRTGNDRRCDRLARLPPELPSKATTSEPEPSPLHRGLPIPHLGDQGPDRPIGPRSFLSTRFAGIRRDQRHADSTSPPPVIALRGGLSSMHALGGFRPDRLAQERSLAQVHARGRQPVLMKVLAAHGEDDGMSMSVTSYCCAWTFVGTHGFRCADVGSSVRVAETVVLVPSGRVLTRQFAEHGCVEVPVGGAVEDREGLVDGRVSPRASVVDEEIDDEQPREVRHRAAVRPEDRHPRGRERPVSVPSPLSVICTS